MKYRFDPPHPTHVIVGCPCPGQVLRAGETVTLEREPHPALLAAGLVRVDPVSMAAPPALEPDTSGSGAYNSGLAELSAREVVSLARSQGYTGPRRRDAAAEYLEGLR